MHHKHGAGTLNAISMSPSSFRRRKRRRKILRRLAAAKIPTVCGTTGWLEHLPDVTAAVNQTGTSLVWSPNFSVGVAVFRRLAGVAAELLNE